MAEAIAARLGARAVLEVSGADARPLLQGLVSADIGRLAPERALWGALLTPQGRYLFDFGLVDTGTSILLDAERARIAELVQRLTLYRLRAQAEILDRSEAWTVLGLPDPDAPERFGLSRDRGACRRIGAAIVLVDPRLAALGVRALVPPTALEPFLEAHGLRLVDAAVWDAHRLALGVPDGSRDLVVHKALPLECNLAELGAVAFDKGCFVGQELTARMHHRGLIKKRLVPVRIEGPLPPEGTPVRLGDREVGELRSGRDGRALALLRLEALGEQPLRADSSVVRPELPAWLQRVFDP